MTPDIAIRYGETDVDAVAIHRFLLEVAQPVLLGRIDIRKSLFEVARVIREGAAILALLDEQLVGSLGIIRATWWYGPDEFLTDRWFFVHPQFLHAGVGARLQAEAHVIGFEAGLDVILNGHMRRRIKHIGQGMLFTLPQVLPSDTEPSREQEEGDIPQFLPVRH